MSPRTATFLTALGLLAAGAPLPFLMHTHEESERHHACCGHEHHTRAEDNHADTYRVPVTILCSHRVLSLKLMLGDRVLAKSDIVGTLWEPTLTLPVAESYDIEVVAVWEDEGQHALSLTLDVPRRETRNVTHWGDKVLRQLYRFSW